MLKAKKLRLEMDLEPFSVLFTTIHIGREKNTPKVLLDNLIQISVIKEISGGEANLTRANGLVPIPAETFNQG